MVNFSICMGHKIRLYKLQYLKRNLRTFMLFKIKQRTLKANKNEERIWVQSRECNEVFYSKLRPWESCSGERCLDLLEYLSGLKMVMCRMKPASVVKVKPQKWLKIRGGDFALMRERWTCGWVRP